MLRFIADRSARNGTITRREWLRLGGYGGLGLALPTIAGGAASRKYPGFGQAKSVILVYASGGQSQIDTWDMKPAAPEEIRGIFRPVATSVPGTFICEHMPRLARLANRYTIVRSVAHDDLDHGSATYMALTGHPHPRKSSNPPPRPSDYPTYGSILKRVRPAARFPHTAVHINGPALVPEVVGPGQFGGFLGHDFDPLNVGDVTSGHVAIGGLDPLPGLPPVRLESRRTLLQSVNGYRAKLEQNRALLDMDGLYRQAYQMLSAPRCRRAFDLGEEPLAIRERYGRNQSGQSCLLARRLVEAGVPFITVIWNHSNRGQDRTPDEPDTYGWDTHNDIFDALKTCLLPRFDRSFSALLEDLESRGLLEQTLVVCMGEFGRAPRIALEKRFAGSSPGRKHWAGVYSIVLAGAGVARGGVVGSSDRIGGHPQSSAVGPWDVAATMFSALGIDPADTFRDANGRPYGISEGQPIAGIYSG